LNRFVVRLTADDGTIVAESDGVTGAPLAIPVADLPETSPDDDAPATDDAPAAEPLPELLVWVDTGRKIVSSYAS
jgi:hypothetical protein